MVQAPGKPQALQAFPVTEPALLLGGTQDTQLPGAGETLQGRGHWQTPGCPVLC